MLLQRLQPYSLELRADVLTDASLLHLTGTNDTSVDGAGHAVLLLDVQLGQSVLYNDHSTQLPTLIDGGVTDISLGGGVDNVSHLETLDGLILRVLRPNQHFAP